MFGVLSMTQPHGDGPGAQSTPSPGGKVLAACARLIPCFATAAPGSDSTVLLCSA